MIKILEPKKNNNNYTQDNKVIDNIKTLILDNIYDNNIKFQSVNFSFCKILYALLTRYIKYDKEKIITSLPITPLINSTLYMCSKITVEDLKNNNQSFYTYNQDDGFSLSIGDAVGKSIINSKYENVKRKNIYFSNTYYLCDDKILNEGKNYTCIKLAGEYKLNRLITVCLINNEKYTEKLHETFKINSWNVYKINEDSDFNTIFDTLKKATSSKTKPVCILIKKQNEKSIKDNSMLNLKTVTNYKKKFGIRDILYTVYEDNTSYCKILDEVLIKEQNKIKIIYKETNENNETNILLNGIDDEEFKINKLISIEDVKYNYNLSDYKDIVGGIQSGIYNLGFKVISITKLKDSNYLLPNIIKSTLNNEHILYIIEEGYDDLDKNYISINYLRSIPDLSFYRPCSNNEFLGAYKSFLKNNNTSVIVIPDFYDKQIKNTKIDEVDNGAYYLTNEKGSAGILISSGVDVSIALDVYKKLKSIGIIINVVSMPSTYRFMIQDNKYKDKILKNKAKAVVESSLSLYWYSFGLNDKQICCIKRIDKESLNIRKTCKLTVDDVYNKVKKIYTKSSKE